MVKINIAIVGYGKMGHEVERIAKLKNINVVSTIDPINKEARFREINNESMRNVDVCIDFSIPEAVIENIKTIASFKKNIVLATTGWYGKIDEVKKLVKKNNIGLIWSGNFSIGVNLFFRIIENSAKLINNIDDYDVFAYEIHHNRKKDSPSGTASMIGDILIKNIKRKTSIVTEKLDRKIAPNEIHFASVRGGDVPGTHVICFDSGADTIELKHIARNREGFALGSILAAEWIKGKKGFFGIDDFMKDIINRKR